MEYKAQVKCRVCNKWFERWYSEIEKCIKRGSKHLCCSLSCHAKINGKTRSITAKTKAEQTARIKKFNNNRRDHLTPFRWYLARAKARSSKKGDDQLTNLTSEYLKDLWERQQGVCPLTGWKMNLADSTSGFSDSKHPKNASLDRVDSSKWYVKDNVRFISLIANYAKAEWDDQWVIDFAKSVMAYV